MTHAIGTAREQKETLVVNPKMQFILIGFSQASGTRLFTFQGIAADRTRTVFTVGTELALTRRYGIPLQELPLLCRKILEQSEESGKKRAFTYTEKDMVLFADGVAARDEAAKKKRPPRRSPTEQLGTAWRTQPRQPEHEQLDSAAAGSTVAGQ